jgi:hypothetical protein
MRVSDRLFRTAEQDDGMAGLEAVVHGGGFWRLVPDEIPRTYEPLTRELMERVLHGLGRLAG